MAKLKAFVASLDEVPAEFHGLYAQHDDGRWKLDADGVEDISGLKSALQKEREEARKARATIEKYRDVDPEKYRELLQKHEETERERLEAKGQYEALVAQIKDKHGQELGKLQSEIKELVSEIERRAIDAEALQYIAELKGRPKLLLPHVKAQARVVKRDGRWVTEVVDENGHVRIKDGTGVPMTLKDLVSEMKTLDEFAVAFDAEQKSGGGAPPQKSAGGGASGRVWTKAELKDPKNYAQARDEAVKAGRQPNEIMVAD